MSELALKVLSIVFSAAIVAGFVLLYTVPFFKRHKYACSASLCMLLTGVCAVMFGLGGAQVGSPALIVAASVLLGIATAFAAIAVLILVGVVPVKPRSKMSSLTGLVISVVLLLHVTASTAYPFDFDNGDPMNGGTLVARILSGAFQSFTLDAGYAELIRVGMDNLGVFGGVFAVLGCAITIVAPVVGGFALFGALGFFFPRIALWHSSRRTKYVFSELNEYSIETAESIADLREKLRSDKTEREAYARRYGKAACDEVKNSVIIFTDVYSDNESEVDSELLRRAKDINAICLKDDICSRKISWKYGPVMRLFGVKKKVIYFLIDKSDFYVEHGEENNLQTAVALFSEGGSRASWAHKHFAADEMEMYVFSRNENADDLIAAACNDWKAGDKTGISPLFKVINEYRNLIYGLIDDDPPGEAAGSGKKYPLYSAIRGKPEKLSVLILGGGRIAKEFFKAAYWCGQMLNGDRPAKLKITVMSLDADKTKDKLMFELPEVFAPALCDYAHNPDSYCEFDFVPAQYGTAEFYQSFRKVATNAGKLDVNYVLVALGADNLNMQAADGIRCELGRLGKCGKTVPINYVIENTALLGALDRDTEYDNCVLNPFGSLKQRFSYRNICMPDFEQRAFIADGTYSQKAIRSMLALDHYSRWSSIATALHTPYKIACIESDEDGYARRTGLLEHRRWTAYLRTLGYRCPTAREFAAVCVQSSSGGKQKIKCRRSELKLHACMVECTDSPTTVEDVNAFLSAPENKEFYAVLFDVLGGIAAGAAEYAGLNTLHDVCEHLRRRFDTDFDDLDMLSVMASGGSAYSYKDHDREIPDELRKAWLARA